MPRVFIFVFVQLISLNSGILFFQAPVYKLNVLFLLTFAPDDFSKRFRILKHSTRDASVDTNNCVSSTYPLIFTSGGFEFHGYLRVKVFL